MENPETWNLLTSSLAVCNLDEVDRTWEFLVSQDLVINTLTSRDVFDATVQRVQKEGDITGPTQACRIALSLQSAEIVTDKASTADPWGAIAKASKGIAD